MTAHVRLNYLRVLTVVIGLHSSLLVATTSVSNGPDPSNIETSMNSTPTSVIPTISVSTVNSNDSSDISSSTANSSPGDTTTFSLSPTLSSEMMSPSASSTETVSISPTDSGSNVISTTVNNTNTVLFSMLSSSEMMSASPGITQVPTTLESSFLSNSPSFTHSTEYSTTSGTISASSNVNATVPTMSTTVSTSVISSMPSMSDGSSTTASGLISSTPVSETSSFFSGIETDEHSTMTSQPPASGEATMSSFAPTSVPGNTTDELTNTSSIDITASVNASINSTINFTTSVEVFSTAMTSYPPQASDVVMMSSIAPTSTAPTTPATTTPTATTTQRPTTTTMKYKPVPGNIDDAIFEVSFKLTFICANFSEMQIKEYFENSTEFRSVKLTPAEDGNSCKNNSSRRKRSTSSSEELYNFTAKLPGEFQDSNNNKTENLLRLLKNEGKINITNETIDKIINAVKKQTLDVCQSRYYCPSGFNCPQAFSNKSYCYFMCDLTAFEDECGPHGDCYVELGYDTGVHASKCRCVTDTFYQYGGERCKTKEMTWQMILAIAGGCAGALIVILVFVIIITCIRKKRSNGYNKYGSDGSELHYTDLPEPQHRSSARTYQGLVHSDDRQFSGNSQGYENKAYDYKDYIEADSDLHYRTGAHATNGSRPNNGSRAVNGSRERAWNPDESADVYAKLNTRFDDVNYQYNIKRAQLKNSGDSSDVRTGF